MVEITMNLLKEAPPTQRFNSETKIAVQKKDGKKSPMN